MSKAITNPGLYEPIHALVTMRAVYASISSGLEVPMADHVAVGLIESYLMLAEELGGLLPSGVCFDAVATLATKHGYRLEVS